MYIQDMEKPCDDMHHQTAGSFSQNPAVSAYQENSFLQNFIRFFHGILIPENERRNRMKENNRKSVLSFMEDKWAVFTGRFVQARVIDEQNIRLLFRDVWVDNIYRSYLWAEHTPAFDGMDLKHNCMVQFYGKIHRCSRENEKYGVKECRDVKIVQQAARTKEFDDMNLTFKTVKYDRRQADAEDVSQKAFLKFEDDYGFGRHDRIRLVYSPVLTMRNDSNEIEFDAYDEHGKLAEFSRISFSPLYSCHKVFIDNKYSIKINETLYRKLSLLYYLVTRTQDGCMAFIPKESKNEYFAVSSTEETVYYHNMQKLYTQKKGGAACRQDSEQESLQKAVCEA